MNERYDALDANNKLIWNLRDIGHTMRHISEGKGSQKRVLMVLRETGGMTQRELTEWLGIQPGSASEVVGKLEAAGLLLRTTSEKDRRTTDLRLTAEGEKAAKEAFIKREERHDKMFACLTAAEKQTLLSLLEKVNASWDEQYRGGDAEPSDSNFRKGQRHHCRK
ncbi:MAG: MarR family transcriptional regulator [Roseburia sp.]|nr:MarR family transcriptional regulator [Roseburia sp.]